MSRYIEIDTALLKTVTAGGLSAKALWKRIMQQPSIDIVRCSECVYCNVQNTKYLYAICEIHGIAFKPFEDDTRTHGCAWGKQTERSSE